MERELIPPEYRGWWRIVEGSHWRGKDFERPGPALISLTGYGDRLRIFVLLAYVSCKATKSGVSFTWEGAWEFDPVSGTGEVELDEDGRLMGVIRIQGGEKCRFTASRSVEPHEPIPDPPSYRDKWRRRW
jgi:hypothetical protein